MSINVIIAAIIALLVLIVLALIFTGRIGGINKNIGDCENKGGTCASIDAGGCMPGTAQSPIFSCGSDTKVCCIPIGSE